MSGILALVEGGAGGNLYVCHTSEQIPVVYAAPPPPPPWPAMGAFAAWAMISHCMGYVIHWVVSWLKALIGGLPSEHCMFGTLFTTYRPCMLIPGQLWEPTFAVWALIVHCKGYVFQWIKSCLKALMGVGTAGKLAVWSWWHVVQSWPAMRAFSQFWDIDCPLQGLSISLVEISAHGFDRRWNRVEFACFDFLIPHMVYVCWTLSSNLNFGPTFAVSALFAHCKESRFKAFMGGGTAGKFGVWSPWQYRAILDNLLKKDGYATPLTWSRIYKVLFRGYFNDNVFIWWYRFSKIVYQQVDWREWLEIAT